MGCKRLQRKGDKRRTRERRAAAREKKKKAEDARAFCTMVKGVCAFGGASLVRIHDHGVTARLCCVCGDREATAATGVKASHSWRGRIFHIDGGAENGRSIGRARTFYTMIKSVPRYFLDVNVPEHACLYSIILLLSTSTYLFWVHIFVLPSKYSTSSVQIPVIFISFSKFKGQLFGSFIK